MRRQTIFRSLLVLLFLSIPAQVALANGAAWLSPVLYVPGLVVLSPLLGLPVTLAAAILERPFVSLAGVRSHALERSIRGNLLSWLVGLTIMFGVSLAVYFIATVPMSYVVAVETTLSLLAMPFFILAIAVSILVEGGYYQTILRREGGILRWRWVVAANVFSNVVLVAMAFGPGILRENHPRLVRNVEPHLETVWWILAAICLALVVFAFRPLREPVQAATEPSQPAAPAETPREEVAAP